MTGGTRSDTGASAPTVTVASRAVEGRTALSGAKAPGRRRRPSGEPPPLPRSSRAHARSLLAVAAATVALTVGMYVRPVLAALTSADNTMLRWGSGVRNGFLTGAFRAADQLGSSWTIRFLAWGTIAALVVFRRFRHLTVYLAALLGCSLIGSIVAVTSGRMRPSGLTILGSWTGYSYPSRPLAIFAFTAFAAVYALVPTGIWRKRTTWLAAVAVLVLACSRLYLAVDHPSDVIAGLVLGSALAVAAFTLLAPEEAFPVTYTRTRKAHLDVGGVRRRAIIQALDQQLGLHAVDVEPYGLAASAGSTPLRIRLSGEGEQPGREVFGKLYALNHLRSDRWYKWVRTVMYGRLEDEKPFSTVRRLVEYEDHMLRLLRDEGLPTPRPYGFAEITPEREYVIVMEYFDRAQEISKADLDDGTITDGLAVVRKLWASGVAHRDIKPSNLLVRDGRVLLIDVAFATVRPTPWRQAVDLANMLLTLSLFSSTERVYRQAVTLFSPDEIAEAMAASRSVTIPSQLRTALKRDERDITAELRQLAPARPPVRIQVWDVPRLIVTLQALAAFAAAAAATYLYLQTTSLL